jgi:molybdenum cofactor cytidylyltransferase
MNRAPSSCGVILAAGESTRMGSDKALLPWPTTKASPPGGETFLSAAIKSLSPFNDLVIVVAGTNEPNLASIVYAHAAFVVRNPAAERGQFSSFQVGLQEVLNRGRNAAMVTLVDRPPVKAATLENLRAEFEAALGRGKWALVPENGGKHGHPILVGREMIEVFLRAPATATAREVEHQHRQKIAYLPVDDRFVTLNVDTPQDYANLGRIQLN